MENKNGQAHSTDKSILTKDEAVKVLLDDGWNLDGTEVIIADFGDEAMTKENVLAISADYKDR